MYSLKRTLVKYWYLNVDVYNFLIRAHERVSIKMYDILNRHHFINTREWNNTNFKIIFPTSVYYYRRNHFQRSMSLHYVHSRKPNITFLQNIFKA